MKALRSNIFEISCEMASVFSKEQKLDFSERSEKFTCIVKQYYK